MSVSPTLLGLLERYSPSGQEGSAADFLVERMAQIGFTDAFKDEVGNAIGVMGGGGTEIVLLGHIDTVPGEIPVRQEGDLLFGRGSVDAKGPLAAFVDAVARQGAADDARITLIAAVEEERDSLGARHIVERHRPDFAIIGEPSAWDRITLGYKGSARLRLEVTRDVAHSAGGGQTASELAVADWARIQAWVEAQNAGISSPFEQLSASLRALHSNSDGLHESARLDLSFRLPLGITLDALLDGLRPLLKDSGADIRVTGHPIAAYLGDKSNALVRAFLGGIRAAGGEPRFVHKTGTADMNIVAPVWDCPTLAYGPGNSALDHTPNEHISISDYEKSVSVLVSVLKRISRLTTTR